MIVLSVLIAMTMMASVFVVVKYLRQIYEELQQPIPQPDIPDLTYVGDRPASREEIDEVLQGEDRLRPTTKVAEVDSKASYFMSFSGIAFLSGVIWFLFFGLGLGISGILVWLLVTGIMLRLIFVAGKINIEEVHIGILKLLGKRIKIQLTEGIHFLPLTRLFMEVIDVDLHERALEVPAQTVISKDGVNVRIGVTIHHRPFNAYDFIEVENIEQALIAYVQRITRDVVADNTGDRCRRGEFIYRKLAQAFIETHFEDYRGVHIFAISPADVTLSNKMEEALQRRSIEEKQAEAEGFEQEFVRRQSRENVRAGLSPKEAREAVEVERGKAEKRIISIQGIDKIAEALGGLLGQALTSGKKEDKQQESDSDE